jgi:hypothetical protein
MKRVTVLGSSRSLLIPRVSSPGMALPEPDDVGEQPLRQPVLAHHRDRLLPALLGEGQRAVVLQVHEPVPLHAAHRLRDGRARVVQPLRDAGPHRGDALLLELEDGAQVHLSGIDEVRHMPIPAFPSDSSASVGALTIL